MEDWEEDIWKRVYFAVKKNGDFSYTLDKEEASQKRYPHKLGEIHSTVLKVPKRLQTSMKRSSTISESSDPSQKTAITVKPLSDETKDKTKEGKDEDKDVDLDQFDLDQKR